MDYRVSILGFIIGVLVGLTGMGGGALMTPALILLKLARPTLAVGTDLVWNALTKAVGSAVHLRQATVDKAIVKRLSLGSIPGALCGIAVLAYLKHVGIGTQDKLVVEVLGVALVAAAGGLFVRSVFGAQLPKPGQEGLSVGPPWLTTVLGFFVGFLVSITSVGSGSLIVACLVFIYPTTPLRRIVGSDIVNALLLVGVSAVGHLGIGSIDTHLLLALLIGSVPGVWIGSRLTAMFPEKFLRPVLGTTLLYLGLKLL